MKRYLVLMGVTAACGSVSGDNKQHDAAVQQPDSRTVDSVGVDAFTCATTPSNLNARWRGENNANDDSGNSYNGTTVGANFGYTPGKHGMAFLMDGTTNEVQISEGDALWPAASFSIELWVKTTSTTAPTLIQKYQCAGSCPAGSYAYFTMRIVTGGNPSFSFRSDATQTDSILTDTTHTVADGNWHHLVGVRDSTAAMAYLYVDGALGGSLSVPTANTGAMTNTDSETDAVTLGAGTVGGTQNIADPLAGALDEVAFYKTALTATQIAHIYAAPEGECP